MLPIKHMLFPQPQLRIRIQRCLRDIEIACYHEIPPLALVAGAFIPEFQMKSSFAHMSISDCFTAMRVAVGIRGAVDGVDVEDYNAMIW